MEFALGDNTNLTAEIAAAANYPQIRFFTVGQCFYSPVPLPSLRSIEQGWTAASPQSVAGGGMFGVFSAVCWFFGRTIADANPGVPIGTRKPTLQYIADATVHRFDFIDSWRFTHFGMDCR